MTNIYEVNQIFEGNYPAEAAVFCNKHNLRIVQIETLDQAKRFQIQEIPALSDDEKSVYLRKKRNELLRDTDFTQINDAPFGAEEKNAYAAYRQYLRDIPAQPEFPNITVQLYADWAK